MTKKESIAFIVGLAYGATAPSEWHMETLIKRIQKEHNLSVDDMTGHNEFDAIVDELAEEYDNHEE